MDNINTYNQFKTYNSYSQNKSSSNSTQSSLDAKPQGSFSDNKFMTNKFAELAKNAALRESEQKKYSKAINLYNISINKNSDDPDTYYHLAKMYKDSGNNSAAIDVYKKLLKIAPDNNEVLTLIGECYKNIGDYSAAKNYYTTAITADPKYDFANRSLKELDNDILAQKDPEKAKAQKLAETSQNLTKSLYLVKNNASPALVKGLKGVNFEFSKTDSLSGYQNIAQYEYSKNRIVVSDKYEYAAPEIIASYITHEAVHAKDRDPYTSIKEEQDGYKAAVEFWINNNHGVKDPELDYAKELYEKSPQTLSDKVRQIYATRDSGIAETSPNHDLMAKSLKGYTSNYNSKVSVAPYKTFLPETTAQTNKHIKINFDSV